MQALFILSLSTLFSIVNPLGALAPFLAMTTSDSPHKKIAMARRACLTSFSVLCVCMIAGAFIFRFYGISLPALKIAGGVLLFLVAVDMVNARPSRTKNTVEEAEEGVQKEDIAIFPLAIPLLSGPGAIASTFILVEKIDHWTHYFAVLLAILITMFVSYLILKQADKIARLLGKIGINVLSRLMGLILAATAIQFILDGVKVVLL